MKRLPFRLNSIAQGTLSTAGRVGRWLFNLAAVISFLLLLGLLIEWRRGYSSREMLTAERVVGSEMFPRHERIILGVNQGAIQFHKFIDWDDSYGARYHDRWVQTLGDGWKLGIETTAPFRVAPPTPSSNHRFKYQRWGNASWWMSESGPGGEIKATSFEDGIRATHVEVPIAYLACSTLILPLVWAIRLVRSRKKQLAGMCVTCGYDLRATPERCPECGTAAKG